MGRREIEAKGARDVGAMGCNGRVVGIGIVRMEGTNAWAGEGFCQYYVMLAEIVHRASCLPNVVGYGIDTFALASASPNAVDSSPTAVIQAFQYIPKYMQPLQSSNVKPL